MKTLNYFLILVFAVAMVACTGDDETITVTEIQCQDGSIVAEGEECPKPEPAEITDSETEETDDTEDTLTDEERRVRDLLREQQRRAQEERQGGGDTQEQTQDQDRGAGGCFQIADTDTDYMAGDGNEVVCGNEKDNIIRGGKGDDILYGRGGNDTLYGGAHRDILRGEGGNDTLIGGEDLDTLDGGGDTDIVDYSQEAGTQGVTVDLVAGSATDTHGDNDTLISIENVKGTTEADTIKGDNGPNVIDGVTVASDTLLDGRGGSDTIVVRASFNLGDAQDESTEDQPIRNFENIEGRGATALALTGDDKANTITGSDAGTVADTINGEGGNDTLYGRRGDDTLNGGPGRDNLYGGPGTDCFQLHVPIIEAFSDPVTSAEIATARRDITATLDTVHDFNEDSVEIAGTLSGIEADIRKDKVVIVLRAEVPDDPNTPGNQRVAEVIATLANVKGLLATDTLGCN